MEPGGSRGSPLRIVLAGWLVVGCCASGLGRIEPRPAADYQERIQDLSGQAPLGSTAVVSPPFVVIGDGPPDEVRAVAEGVVGWAVKRLKRDFFARDPESIIEIWMFRDLRSYLENTSALFSYTPSTPFGYFDRCDDVVVVNTSLGVGTLVHEIVHAFMAANFPRAPTWFNEGLASLFERPTEVEGHIQGRVNWRLRGLQRAIHSGDAPGLAGLMASSRGEFYAQPGAATRYAAARYLLYYLQSQGVLRKYYRHFVRHQAQDGTGAASLLAVTGARDLSHFEGDWKSFVMKLWYSSPSREGSKTKDSAGMAACGRDHECVVDPADDPADAWAEPDSKCCSSIFDRDAQGSGS